MQSVTTTVIGIWSPANGTSTRMINMHSRTFICLCAFVCATFFGFLVIRSPFWNSKESEVKRLPPPPTNSIDSFSDDSTQELSRISNNRLSSQSQRMAVRSQDLAERRRLEKWKQRFPWEPVVDDNFPYVPHKYVPGYKPTNSYEGTVILEQKHNYKNLKRFFSNEVRYTAQFESMYNILEKYNRNNDPALAKRVFEHLWNYHHHKDTNAYKAKSYKSGVIAALTSPRNADEYYFSPEGIKEAEIIADDLIDNVKEMQSIPYPWPITEEEHRTKQTYDMRIMSGDPDLVGDFLVPYVGWADKYAELMKEQRRAPTRAIVNLPKLPPGYPSGPAYVLVPVKDENGNIKMIQQKVGTLKVEDEQQQKSLPNK